ncbi:TY-Chap domain-containing protein [Streptosporangium longisporum]|uniref:TY-Chap N-terminal domain-containing protein n=1 Tax=Streptosporangium longisporum TaxID=46187 RepID=A0ABN3YEW1_9ACTN
MGHPSTAPRGDDDTGDSIWDVLAEPHVVEYHTGEQGRFAHSWLVSCLDDCESAGDRVRLGDSTTGTYVMLSLFMEEYAHAEIFEARGLSDVQRERLHALGWRPETTGTSPIRPTWSLRWGWYEPDKEHLARCGEAVIGALRDVLAVPPERLRCRSWGEDGPLDVPDRLRDRDERPTATGAPALCTGWEDLRRRLDWVLLTLPTESAVVMRNEDHGVVQFMTGVDGLVSTGAIDHHPGGPELPEPGDPRTDRERRLFEIGWTPETATPAYIGWTLGTPIIWADAGPPATQAVEALRALGFHDPSEITVRTFRNGRGLGPVAYVAGELGLRPEKT